MDYQFIYCDYLGISWDTGLGGYKFGTILALRYLEPKHSEDNEYMDLHAKAKCLPRVLQLDVTG